MATTKVSGELVDLNDSTSESGLKMPSGTEANRPTPVAGQIRNNTNETSASSASCMEYYKSGAWQKINNVPLPPEFGIALYDGNSSTNNITGLGFAPDWVWIKERGPSSEQSNLYDTSRGVQKFIVSNSTAAEVTGSSNRLNAFGSDGFTVGSDNEINDSGSTYVAWCWKANGGTKTTNNNGSIQSSVQANDAAGFSIIEYTGANSSGTGTFGHGLSTAPSLFILRDLENNSNWIVWASAFGDVTKNLQLQSTSSLFSSNIANSTAPSSTVISISADNDVNNDGKAYICYAFADVSGYSKFGTYSGTGSSNPITGLGFQPQYVMIKSTTSSEDWAIFDASRGANLFLTANTSSADQSFSGFSFDTDGFTVPGTSGMTNGSGQTYFYMAFK